MTVTGEQEWWLVELDHALQETDACLPLRIPVTAEGFVLNVILAESFGLVLGIRECVREALATPALILGRTLLENVVRVEWITARPGEEVRRSIRYCSEVLSREAGMAQGTQQVSGTDLTPHLELIRQQQEVVAEWAADAGMTRVRKTPSLSDMAEQTHLNHQEIAHGYGILSGGYAHTGWGSLARRIVEKPGSAGAFTPRERDAAALSRSAMLAVVGLSDVLNAVAGCLGWEGGARARELAVHISEVWHARFEELHPDGSIWLW